MIEATGLSKHYGSIRAVDDVSFRIEAGECVGLLGLNGAGKTTLLRIMSCLLTPTSGRITVDGHDVAEVPEEVRLRIGFLPEDAPSYEEMTVESFLEFVARLRKVPENKVKERTRDVAARCRVDNVINQRIETLSHGYKKRVGIAQSIVHNPPLVILDEPISGLDPAQIVEMRDLVRGLKGAHTVVISSHILSEVSQTCDRILVMRNGRIAASGTEAELSSEMKQETRLQVQIRGDAERVKSALSGLDGISGCDLAAQEDGVTTLEISTSKDVRPEISRAIVQSGADLLGLSRKQSKLESLFLDLTGDKKRPE